MSGSLNEFRRYSDHDGTAWPDRRHANRLGPLMTGSVVSAGERIRPDEFIVQQDFTLLCGPTGMTGRYEYACMKEEGGSGLIPDLRCGPKAVLYGETIIQTAGEMPYMNHSILSLESPVRETATVYKFKKILFCIDLGPLL